MIPSYLVDLELPQVFGNYVQVAENYIVESCNNEHIVDSEEKKVSGFVTASFGQTENAAGKYFAVTNPSATPYSLLQIDNGLIKSIDTMKCDCAIVNDKKLCLIEFKANATSSKTSAIKRNYRKALKQLKTTIGIFNQHYSISGKKVTSLRTVEAFVCFRQGYPRNTSTQMNYMAWFALENDGVSLSFNNSKVL